MTKHVTSAPGAVQLSSQDGSLTSHASAGQGVIPAAEPKATPATSLPQGEGLSRRRFMNKLVSLPLVAAMPITAPAMPATKLDALERTALPGPDAELLDLAERFLKAEREWGELECAADAMATRNRNIAPPAVLSPRDGDRELGLPNPCPEGRYPGIYGRGSVNEMRPQTWAAMTHTQHEDGDDFTIAWRHTMPTVEARARADEIIAAYDKWQKRMCRKPNGYHAAKRAADAALRRSQELEDKILETGATSIRGLIAKARCEQAVPGGPFADSICDDLLALAEESEEA